MIEMRTDDINKFRFKEGDQALLKLRVKSGRYQGETHYEVFTYFNNENDLCDPVLYAPLRALLNDREIVGWLPLDD